MKNSYNKKNDKYIYYGITFLKKTLINPRI